MKKTKRDQIYRNLGEQLLDIMAMTQRTIDAPRARDRHQAVVNANSGLHTENGDEGGYLVDIEHSRDIYTTAIETGVFSNRCADQPIGGMADSYSYLSADDRARSDGLINGLAVYRKAESETMESTGKAILDWRELRVTDMYGLVYVTNRMLRDTTAMSAYIKRNLTKQFAFKLNQEIYKGTGAGQCQGIMNSSLLVTVPKETSQVTKTINAKNIVNMFARFHGDISRVAWFINKDTLRSLPLVTGNGFPLYSGSSRDAPFGRLLGCPVVPAEHCKTIGNKGDIVLADFGEYLLINKGGTEITKSMHVKFLTDESAFRFIVRNNGQPLADKPITPLNGTDTLSPFVMLQDRL